MSKLQSLYDYTIKQYGSPEQALKAILYFNLDGYDQARNTEMEDIAPEMEGHPIVIITMAAMELNWDLAVETNQNFVRGLSMGTPEYLDAIFSAPEEAEVEVLFDPDNDFELGIDDIEGEDIDPEDEDENS